MIDLVGLKSRCGSLLPDRGRGSHAFEIVKWFGEPLARAWLQAEVITAAQNFRDECYGKAPSAGAVASGGISIARGQCRLLMVTSDTLPLLKPSFILPVEWRRCSEVGESSSRLPIGLAVFAAGVLRDIRVEGLSLHLPDSWESAGIDMSRLLFFHKSAWGSLAAGAAIFQQHGATVSDVMVTAAWSSEGDGGHGWISPVCGVLAKCNAAQEAGARVLFVPRANMSDVEQWRQKPDSDQSLEIRWLSDEVTNPRRAIGPILASLEVRPSRAVGDSFDRLCDYHARMPSSDADEFYRSELVEDACARLLDRLPRELRPPGRVRKLTFIASRSLAVPWLLTSLFDPDQILILHDGGLDVGLIDDCRWTLPTLKRAGGHPRLVRVDECAPESLEADVHRHLEVFERDFPLGQLLVDLTPGYRAFNLALLAAAPPQAVLIYVHSPQAKDSSPGQIRAGQEEVRVFRVSR